MGRAAPGRAARGASKPRRPRRHDRRYTGEGARTRTARRSGPFVGRVTEGYRKTGDVTGLHTL